MEYPMIHICYRVMDLDASEEFYSKAFGFKVSRKKDYPDGKFTLSYMTSADLPFELELTYNYDQQEPYVIGDGYSHLAVAVADLEANGEAVPEPFAVRSFSGKFVVRVPPEVHRELALEAAEAGVSLNRLASAKLTR